MRLGTTYTIVGLPPKSVLIHDSLVCFFRVHGALGFAQGLGFRDFAGLGCEIFMDRVSFRLQSGAAGLKTQSPNGV